MYYPQGLITLSFRSFTLKDEGPGRSEVWMGIACTESLVSPRIEPLCAPDPVVHGITIRQSTHSVLTVDETLAFEHRVLRVFITTT